MLQRLIPTLPVEIHDDHSDYTPQQRLVIEQKYYGLNQLDKANDALDDKALRLLEAAGLILALVSVLKLPHFVFNPGSNVLAVLALAIGFITFLAMIYLSLQAWSPRGTGTPGILDKTRIYSDYIDETRNECYDQVLVDLLATYDLLLRINERKSAGLQRSIYLFAIQVAALLALALLPI